MLNKKSVPERNWKLSDDLQDKTQFLFFDLSTMILKFFLDVDEIDNEAVRDAKFETNSTYFVENFKLVLIFEVSKLLVVG